MDILVVGGGGREHAIAWKLRQSPRCGRLYCAPGNGGISAVAECVPIKTMDIPGIVRFAKDKSIGLVMVAPDDPLAAGMVDALEDAGVRAFGPGKDAALIESSKVFSKSLMIKYNIPTAAYEVFDDRTEAVEYVRRLKPPIVVKADGLALGKGVVIAQDCYQAEEAINRIMGDKQFGSSGDRIVVEEFLKGPEVSVLSFTDGKTVVPMVSSQDHKRVFDNDKGPNTGGMGAFSPSRIYTPQMAEYCMENIYKPTIAAMAAEGRKFKGVLYFGLLMTEDGPKVLEYNSRFGDPETQVVLPRLKCDLLDVFEAIIDERLDQACIEWTDDAAVCIVAASGGYPDKYETGHVIEGLDEALKTGDGDIAIFHSGTKLDGGRYLTAGGRVLGITAKAGSIESAAKKAYGAMAAVSFKDMHYRKDIGI